MKKKDFILIITALTIVLIFILFPGETDCDAVKIFKNGKIYCEKSLYESCEINIDEKNIAVIENGCIYMKEADCPDKLCIRQGKAFDSSKKIVCLPNRVIIEVTSKSSLDTVVR